MRNLDREKTRGVASHVCPVTYLRRAEQQYLVSTSLYSTKYFQEMVNRQIHLEYIYPIYPTEQRIEQEQIVTVSNYIPP